MRIDSTITFLLNGSHSLYVDGVAWFATQTLSWIPLLLALLYVLFRAHSLKQFIYLLLVLTLCVLIVDQVSSSLFKPMVERYRPSQNPYVMHLVDIVNGYRGGSYGFFSSHAANTAAVSTFSALLLRHRYVTWSLGGWTVINCWTRLYLGVHYVGDILMGVFMGGMVATVLYFLYLYICPEQKGRSYSPLLLKIIPTGLALSLCSSTIPWKHFF